MCRSTSSSSRGCCLLLIKSASKYASAMDLTIQSLSRKRGLEALTIAVCTTHHQNHLPLLVKGEVITSKIDQLTEAEVEAETEGAFLQLLKLNLIWIEPTFAPEARMADRARSSAVFNIFNCRKTRLNYSNKEFV